MDLTPLLFPFLLILAILGFILALRYMQHRERMAMIQKGLAPHSDLAVPITSRSIESRLRLYAGSILTALGAALGLVIGFDKGFGPDMAVGLIPLLVGLTLLLLHLILGNR